MSKFLKEYLEKNPDIQESINEAISDYYDDNNLNSNSNDSEDTDNSGLSEYQYQTIDEKTGNFKEGEITTAAPKVLNINKFNNQPNFDDVNEIKEDGYYGNDDISTRESTIESGNGYEMVDIPRWGYKDFINERIDWLKGTKSILGEPAWFYFKIFFKFDTKQGLLGGVFSPKKQDKEQDIKTIGVNTTNTAMKYLQRISQPITSSNRYSSDDSNSSYNYAQIRIKYLYQFIRTLAYISSDAPWFFSSVHDVNNTMAMDFNDLTKEKSITIDCLEDAIDMRLLTMMDLYRQACFDDVMQKEIIPENLRKFDMDIVVFQTPIRYLHTSSIDLRSRKTTYKSLDGTDSGTRMSFKLFSFRNCEFDLSSLASMLPSTFTNDKPFTSKPTIKINYDRVYQHTSNEFIQSMFGSGGSTDQLNDKYFNEDYEGGISDVQQSNATAKSNSLLRFLGIPATVTVTGSHCNSSGESTIRANQLKYLHEHPTYYNPNSNVYKALVDASETKISSAMRMIDSSAAFGNLYGEAKSLGNTIASDVKGVLKTAGNAYKNMGKSFINRWKF